MEQLTKDIYLATMDEEDKEKMAWWQQELEESFKKETQKNKGGK